MSVTGTDFYEAAKRIAASAAFEIDRRNSISRVYYAAFHLCLSKLSQGGGFDPNAGHYEFCQTLLSHPAGSTLRNLGVGLNHLRQQRNAADYALGRDFVATDVTTAFGAYGNVMRFLAAAAA